MFNNSYNIPINNNQSIINYDKITTKIDNLENLSWYDTYIIILLSILIVVCFFSIALFI